MPRTTQTEAGTKVRQKKNATKAPRTSGMHCAFGTHRRPLVPSCLRGYSAYSLHHRIANPALKIRMKSRNFRKCVT